MYCSNCGSQLPNDARFCKKCGAATAGNGPAAPPAATGGGGSGSRGIWVALAAIGIVVIALAIALPLIFLRANDTTGVVFTRNGIEVSEFASGTMRQIDPAGDFATAAPTYVAYFRPTPAGDGTIWAIVARGLTGSYEQVLLKDAGSPPWFLGPIATSAHRIAFAIDGVLHLFQWQTS